MANEGGARDKPPRNGMRDYITISSYCNVILESIYRLSRRPAAQKFAAALSNHSPMNFQLPRYSLNRAHLSSEITARWGTKSDTKPQYSGACSSLDQVQLVVTVCNNRESLKPSWIVEIRRI